MTAPEPTILLVEDNEVNRDMLVRRLQRAGHEVATAADGEAALTAMREQQPAVVLLSLLPISRPREQGWFCLAFFCLKTNLASTLLFTFQTKLHGGLSLRTIAL